MSFLTSKFLRVYELTGNVHFTFELAARGQIFRRDSHEGDAGDLLGFGAVLRRNREGAFKHQDSNINHIRDTPSSISFDIADRNYPSLNGKG
jgi:hypothetical protein